MIFVTVGTHEQQFDRLIKEIDNLVKEGIINEEVFIQLGYSNYTPKYCEYSKLINYEDMVEKTTKARIVISHGGPGSIMLSLSLNKIPIVVPRQEKYGEHVDDHQVLFSKRLQKEGKILAIYEIEQLRDKIINYNEYTEQMQNNLSKSNLDHFIQRLDAIAESLVINR
jgi:UDP-N-acetylglucosamine transferase subunit ALG13